MVHEFGKVIVKQPLLKANFGRVCFSKLQSYILSFEGLTSTPELDDFSASA
jgi:hypothetical protein